MMRKIGFFVFQFCLISIFMGSAAWADTVFSFNGVGDPTRRMDVRARAMGGAGRALADGENFSSSNPALIAAFAQPGVTSLYFIQRRSLKDNLGNQHVVTDGDIGSFQLALPLKRGTVLGIGLEPLTEVDFIVVEPGGSGPLAHTLRIDGTGGIQAVTLSLGQQMGRLYLGGRMDMVFMGTISEVWRKDYDSEIVTDLDGANLPRLLDTEDKYIRTHRGLLGAVGGVYRPTANWFLGLAFQAGGKLTQTRTLRNFFANLGFEPDVKLKADVELPIRIGGGVAYATRYHWRVALDFERSFWARTGPGRYNTNEIAGGFTYRTGKPDPLVRSKRLELSAGAHYRSLYFSTAGGDPVTETGLSLGLALPFQTRNAGKLRYVLEVGRRGSVSSHGVSERFIMQTFSFTGWIR